MRIRLGQNNYGKSRVRLLRVSRASSSHEIKEITIAIRLEGDFESAHTIGDNSKILPTDTMKNTVYVLAKQYPPEPIEEFSAHLIEHFLTYNPQVARAEIECTENLWSRIPVGGKPHDTAFMRAAGEKRTSLVAATRAAAEFSAGISDLVILKSAQSGFEGYIHDPYTTLKERSDRILATSMRAEWVYVSEGIAFSSVWHGVRKLLLETFAEHDSLSLQHTLYAMGEAVLGNFEQIQEIRLSMPNKHYNLVDLQPFGLENDNEIFLPIDEPHGLIEATLRREI
jgi:urate oxidase